MSDSPGLLRRLGALDGALLTVGSVVGTGVFLTAGDVARAVPHAGLVLLVWLAGGLLTLAGALTYAELGTMYPRAGGVYHYLVEAYGPVWGFLYGWACFMVIMSGGLAAIAVGFGEYLGAFVPVLSSATIWWRLPLGGGAWVVNGAQVAAVCAILLLTAVNHIGVSAGALTQNLLTALKVVAIAMLGVCGLMVHAPAEPQLMAALPAVPIAGAIGVAMVAVLWTYDGWYALTFAAGELRDPARTLPRGLILGTGIVMLLYLLLNLTYLRALPLETLAHTPRVAESAARALFGEGSARLTVALVVVSSFGCLASTILYSSRLYAPMAADGHFFARLARVHPRWHTPVGSLWAQSAWACVLALSGSYQQLYTGSVFIGLVAFAAAGAAVLDCAQLGPRSIARIACGDIPWCPRCSCWG